jgi:hypothetical protein
VALYPSSITSKTIRVSTCSGDIRVKLSNETELERVLQRKNATCFVDGEKTQIHGFDSLENEGSNTYGPALAAHAQQQHRRSHRKHAPVKLTDKKTMGGGKKGAKKDDKSQAFWFLLCQKYANSKASNGLPALRRVRSEVGENHGKLENVNETFVFAKQSGYPKRSVDLPDRAAHVIQNPEEVELSYKRFHPRPLKLRRTP